MVKWGLGSPNDPKAKPMERMGSRRTGLCGSLCHLGHGLLPNNT
jgi:hypothetical protein